MADPDRKEAIRLSEEFATHALDAQYEDLTADAIAQTKVFILDTLGVGISGSSAFGADRILEAASTWGVGEEATLWGRRQRVPAGIAALMNAYQVHCQEYDCVHEGAVLHPLATLLPAALAYAERAGGISGRELIVACAVGVNVSAGLGIASRSPMRFFRPATAGGFGATAAVGRLMKLSHRSLVHAFGIMYAQTSGTLQPYVEGNTSLPLQVGLNSRAALQACELARAGFSGPRDVFEGPEPWDLTETMKCLQGKRWLVAEISHKPYPAGRATHGGVEGLMVLMNQSSRRVQSDEIESVTITGPPVTVRLCSRPDRLDPPPNYARLCMSYIGAKVLLNGSIDLAHYRGEELTDAKTHELAQRITMVSDEQEDPNALVPVSVEMQLTSGEVRYWKCEQMLASPARRLTREQHLTKFRRCWGFAEEAIETERQEKLIAMVDNLEGVADVREMISQLSPSDLSAKLPVRSLGTCEAMRSP
ncbi:MmgE/PrpD [Xylariomycetidae sp. FL2044]|nr:MmgE/PrpD [Xylariomycetidae sp. FL2044]